MDEALRTVLISGGVSLVVAIVTAIITSRQAVKQEVKKAVYAKREAAYIALFDLLNAFKDNPYLVYNRDAFVHPLSELRTRLNLFASQDALDTLEPLYSKIKEVAFAYWKKFGGEEYENYRANRIQYDNATEDDLQHEDDDYQEAHLIDCDTVESTIAKLISIMRKDMGTK